MTLHQSLAGCASGVNSAAAFFVRSSAPSPVAADASAAAHRHPAAFSTAPASVGVRASGGYWSCAIATPRFAAAAW